MQPQLYQPFKKMQFDNQICFLTGERLANKDQKISVFPTWLIEAYELHLKPMKMLNESVLTYADIFVPCSLNAQQKLQELENTIQQAFEKGYDAVKELDQLQLFQWVAKMVYGIIFKEIQTAIKEQKSNPEGFNMSQGLIHKFSMLHQMLQTVNQPVVLEGFKPYSIFICKLNHPNNEFFYRDEINTLTFSYKIASQTLHPIQFEELCAKVFYSAYLFNRLPEYHIIPTDDLIYIEAMPLRGMNAKPIFDDWNFKIYGQVVENFWKAWGFLLLEIIKNPEKPMSFILDDNEEFVYAKSIELPIME